MNSEKVKEIKKALEQNDDNGIIYEVDDKKRICKFMHHKDILTLINELESENKRLMKLQARGGCRVAELGIENQQLKDRIAELEKENALIKNSVAMRDYNTLEEIINNRVKQFAEMLKNNCAYSFIFGQRFITEKRIDELLKGYENEKRNN